MESDKSERDELNGVRQFGSPATMRKHAAFLAANLLLVLLYHSPVYDLMNWSYHHEYFTYIPFIPLISIYVLYLKREVIFAHTKYAIPYGLPLIGFGVFLAFIAMRRQAVLDTADYLALSALAMFFAWLGAFIAVYGMKASLKGLFPLLFLAFIIPPPTALSDAIISMLRSGSTSVAQGIFTVLGIPAVRDGFFFYLPTASVEVAKQCSGIRSALALFITVTLAANLYLRNGWPRMVLVVSALPIAIVKNGIRIAMLTLLGAYYDEAILTHSTIHSRGGIPFFFAALAIEGVFLFYLSRWDRRITKASAGAETAA